MIKRTGFSWITGFALASFLSVSSLSFAFEPAHVVVHEAVIYAEQSTLVSAEEAAALAKQRFGGKVLKLVRKKGPDGGFYRVKLLTPSGKVKTVRVNARNGRVSH